MSTTWSSLLERAAEAVGRSDARRLVEEASGYEGADLILHIDEAATARTIAYLDRMVERRVQGEPLQYVLGRWGFRTLDLMVDRRVLIPRPETEQVVEWAIQEAKQLDRSPLRAADLGAGSGAIGISLAVELRAEVWMTDVSRDALDVATANLTGAGMWAATRVRTAEGSWWEALPADMSGQFDLVVSNPPYVRDEDPLPVEVAAHEPSLALRAGPAGMDAITEIVSGARDWLRPGGVLVVEIDPRQAAATLALATARGATRVSLRVDALGRDRALVAAW